jgi:hypothetical protein
MQVQGVTTDSPADCDRRGYPQIATLLISPTLNGFQFDAMLAVRQKIPHAKRSGPARLKRSRRSIPDEFDREDVQLVRDCPNGSVEFRLLVDPEEITCK